MAFKDLETLYNQRVAELYKHDSSDFNTGEPLLLNKLNPGGMDSTIKYDSRSAPITSTLRDVKRMVKFTMSKDGILSLAKEQLMQTGNAFAYTSIINPAFVVANTVPFVHLPRHLSGTGLLGSTEKYHGRLQKSTGRVARERAIRSIESSSARRPIKGGASGFIDGLVEGIKGTISNVKANLDPSSAIYEEDDRPDIDFFDIIQKEEPEPTGPTKKQEVANILDISPLINVGKPNYQFDQTKTIRSYSDYRDKIRASYATKKNPLTGGDDISYFNDQKFSAVSPDALPIKARGTVYTPEQENAIYKFVNSNPKDFIDIFVHVPNKAKHVKFRAFIRGLKTTAKPEYNSARYIGRTDKYITYSGADRTASFELTLVAFSQEEINGIYSRLNYIQGLVYPLGLATGPTTSDQTHPQLLQPPMIALTLGNIFVNQPGYFDSLTIQYSDTYDIDKQVPFTATIFASYIIIEKEVMFYHTPMVGLFETMTVATPAPASVSTGPNDGIAQQLRNQPIQQVLSTVFNLPVI